LANLLFLLITPAEQPDAQVLLLSQIASIAGNADKRRRLNEATSASDVAEILTMAEEQASVQSTDA
jgi:mannitol/fructose-specific phosphotransferase system IIA component (Ntr-type)